MNDLAPALAMIAGVHVIPWDGQPITVPGIYSGVPNAVYHGQLTHTPSASRSPLWKLFDKSAAHLWRTFYLNPNREEDEGSEALLLGRAAHHLLLGEADFHKYFVVRPDTWDSWRTKDAKKWRAEKELEGFDVLEPKHLELIRGMAEGLAAEPMIQMGALNGLIEHTMVWRDEETGIWCKVRPDAIPNDSLDFTDLKTIADVTDDGVEKAIGETGLNMQGAMVGRACRAIFDREMTSFTLAFTEKKAPHCAQFRTLKPDDLALGDKQVSASLRLLKRSLDSGDWPGPGGRQRDAAYVEMKPFHRTRIEHRLAMIEQELAA